MQFKLFCQLLGHIYPIDSENDLFELRYSWVISVIAPPQKGQ